MESPFALTGALSHVGSSLVRAVADWTPRVFTALAVILIGYLVAKLVERVLRGLFRRVRLDNGLEKIGITDVLQRMGFRGSAGDGLARLSYFLLVVLFVEAATESVGLNAISDAIRAFFAYIPHVIAALAMILLGTVVARMAERMVTRAAEDAGIDYAPALGRVVSALILFVIVVMAVGQLQIDTALVRAVALVLIAGGALAFAITFGLGSRDITRNVLAGFYVRRMVRAGEPIAVSGQRGTLVAVTPVKTVIELEGGEVVAVANASFVREVVRL